MKGQIVISGISGRFPQSDNLEEFWNNLINGIDMVTTDNTRWPIGYLGLPERKGTLKTDLTHFDANFFGIFPAQAERIDPQIRQLLEVTFEAIVDAGVNPNAIRGTNIGVFVGASAHDTFEAYRRTPDLASGYDITGSACCMLANRISYAYDFQGPSFCIDTFCSSSLMALHQGIASIRAGECDGAIIAGVNLLLNPMTALQIQRLGVLSKDGRCKSFDALSDGYVRAEAIAAIFIQKSDTARRSYCNLLHSKTNTDGFKILGVSYPLGSSQQKLMEQTYSEAEINPNDVIYVEPHGTGTAAGDPQEINAIANVFTKENNLKKQILIGSVKTNMGHAEPAAGLCSIAKIILSLREGIIPGNLHYMNPNPNIPALIDGRIKVVTKNTPISGELIAINSTGLGGSNIHVIIQANNTTESITSTFPAVPIIIPISGRTEDSVKYAFEQSAPKISSCEFIGLLHKIAEDPIPQNPYRGFTIFENEIAEPLVDIIKVVPYENPPPLWYVFSGMGTLWCGMMKDLMEFEIFANSIYKSTEILKPFAIDLYDIMMNGTEEILDKYMGCCFVAMGVGLIKLLEAIGLKPEGFIGHSAGELLCSYIDGCISQEESLISYYYKDIAVLKCSGGAMAAVGLTWEESMSRCPKSIFPACHNALNNVTVSGPEEDIHKFINELKNENIFTKKVETGGIAYHSPYLNPILFELEKNVKAIAKNSKHRSSNWISTSIPEKDWFKPNTTKTGSADYIINNIKSPVLFHNALKHIPSNAVVLEISAHSLFVSMLKKSLPETSHVLGLIRKGKGNNAVQFLNAVGKLYQFGFNPKLSTLYKPVKFPVPANTPMIAPIIKWDHSNTHTLPNYLFNGNTGETIVEISLDYEDDAYLSGHVIDGRNVFPSTGYLVLIWKKFANMKGILWDKCPIQFENIRFENVALIPNTGVLKFKINLDNKTGEFEICEGETCLVTGTVQSNQNKLLNHSKFEIDTLHESKTLPLNNDDFYKELRLQGYEYKGLFKGVEMVDNEGKWARITWTENWVTFLDTMMQFSIVSKKCRGFYIPTKLQKLCIDPTSFGEMLENNLKLKDEGIYTTYSKEIESIECPGVQINGLKTSRIQRKIKPQNLPILEEVQFIPYFNMTSSFSKEAGIKYIADLVIENTPNFRLQILERIDNLNESISRTLFNSIRSHPLRLADFTVISDDKQDVETRKSIEEIGFKVFSTSKPWTNTQNLIVLDISSKFDEDILNSLKDGGFVLFHSKISDIKFHDQQYQGLNLVSEVRCTDYVLRLFRKPVNYCVEPQCIFIQNSDYDNWFPKVQDALKKSAIDEDNPRVYLISSNIPTSGIIGFINCLKQEPGGHKIRCIFSKPKIELDFTNIDNRILKHDMTMNVISTNGVIGSYRHLTLSFESLKTHKLPTAFVNIENVGDLSSLKFMEAPSTLAQMVGDEYKCKVYYSALNFRDVMLATGRLPQDSLPGKLATDECVLGLEFAGLDKNTHRVMGMVEARGMATHIIADPMFTWRVPNHWSLEDAATVPVAYSTAYYALIVRGRMKPGEIVLIHSGSGGVGQAAISIALSMKCLVYTTVGSEEKKKFLMGLFPQLKETCFSNSRDTSFENHIIHQTEGRGVDVILNSLSEEKLQASLRCLAEGGRFLEIGKFDLSRNNALGMEVFLKNVTFHGILLDSLFGKNSDEKQKVVHLLENGISSGIVKPLKRIIFENNKLEDAFRFMASGKHIGKILIKIREEDDTNNSSTLINSSVHTYFDPLKVYIIVGGLGGLGLELANWMIQREAKKLFLVSRSDIKNGYQSLLIRRWIDAGIQISIVHTDVTNLIGAEELITIATRIGLIGGIFNLAMILKDGEIVDQTTENFEIVLKPKIQATECLDTISRKLCPDLDYFVVFSSAACGRGNSGQTNYGYANSGMERICEIRKLDNLPALAIQWAAIGDVGIIQDLLNSNDIAVAGTLPQRLSSCLEVLDIFLRNKNLTIVSSMVLPTVSVMTCDDKPSLLNSVSKILGFKNNNSPSNRNTSLGDLGIDSLTIVELKQLLERSCDVIFSTLEIRELTWIKLEELQMK